MKTVQIFLFAVLAMFTIKGQDYTLKPIVDNANPCFCKTVYSYEVFQDKLYVGGWINLSTVENGGYQQLPNVVVDQSAIKSLKNINNKLYIGASYTGLSIYGEITNAGYFDGSDIFSLTGFPGVSVDDFQEYNNEIYAIGKVSDGVGSIARLEEDESWTTIPNGPAGGNAYLDLEVYNGELYAVGHFNSIGGEDNPISVNHIAKWNGTEWTKVGDGAPPTEFLRTMYVWNNKLITSNLDVWDGTQWSSLSSDGIEVSGIYGVSMYGFAEYDGKLFGTNNGGIYYYDEPNALWVQVLDGNSESSAGSPYAGLIPAQPIQDGLYTSYATIENSDPHVLTKENLLLENIESKESYIYPNPAHDFVNVSSTKKVKNIQVYGMDGRLLKSSQLVNQINISELPKGVYSLKIEFKDKSIETKKIIKK